MSIFLYILTHNILPIIAIVGIGFLLGKIFTMDVKTLSKVQFYAFVPVFTFYAARHSWATYARRIGVEKATVDECLCHKGDFALTDIYAERAWGLMTEANAKVIRDTYDGIRGDSST